MKPQEMSEITRDLRFKVSTDILKSINTNISLLMSVLPDLNSQKAQMSILNIPAAGAAAALTSVMLTAGALIHRDRPGKPDFDEEDLAGAIGITITTLYAQGGLFDTDKEQIKELLSGMSEKISEALKGVLPKGSLNLL